MDAQRLYSIIPLLGIVLIAASCRGRTLVKKDEALRERLVTFSGIIPFVALLGFTGIWYGLGKMACGPVFLSGMTGVFTLLGALSVFRDALIKRSSGVSGILLAEARDALLLIVASVYTFFVLDILWNETLLSLQIVFALIAIVSLFAIYLFLYFLGQRTGIAVSLGVVAFTLVGIAQNFVVLFKSSPILPSDIYALGTAAAVSSGYDLTLTKEALWLLVACAVILFLLEFMVPAVGEGKKKIGVFVVINTACALVVGGVALACFNTVDLADTFGTDKAAWQPLASYKYQSFMPSFLTLAQQMRVEAPDGYSQGEAEQLESTYAAAYDNAVDPNVTAGAADQFAEVKPTVIAIMNESFSDLSFMDGLGVGYQGPTYMNTIADAALTGSLSVSVHGGGTANSEFEFLTGNSMAHLGVAFYPYSTFNLSGVSSLPKQFSELGYKTTAIHPNLASNWSRDKAYAELGFDEFIDIEGFEGAETYHAGVTDAATYDKVLELLREDDSPQFIFNLTMQNHGGYTVGNVAQNLPWFDFPAADDSLDAQMNEYLACIEQSDWALADFIEELRTLDRPVVVVFFGDHQPSISSAFNDAMYPGEDEVTHAERIYTTQYFIWANYDIAGNDQISARDDLSTSTLGAKLMEVIGAPMTNYQKASLAARAEVPAINSVGYRGADGLWHDLTAGDRSKTVDDLGWLQYLNLGSKV